MADHPGREERPLDVDDGIAAGAEEREQRGENGRETSRMSGYAGPMRPAPCRSGSAGPRSPTAARRLLRPPVRDAHGASAACCRRRDRRGVAALSCSVRRARIRTRREPSPPRRPRASPPWRPTAEPACRPPAVAPRGSRRVDPDKTLRPGRPHRPRPAGQSRDAPGLGRGAGGRRPARARRGGLLPDPGRHGRGRDLARRRAGGARSARSPSRGPGSTPSSSSPGSSSTSGGAAPPWSGGLAAPQANLSFNRKHQEVAFAVSRKLLRPRRQPRARHRGARHPRIGRRRRGGGARAARPGPGHAARASPRAPGARAGRLRGARTRSARWPMPGGSSPRASASRPPCAHARGRPLGGAPARGAAGLRRAGHRPRAQPAPRPGARASPRSAPARPTSQRARAEFWPRLSFSGSAGRRPSATASAPPLAPSP